MHSLAALKQRVETHGMHIAGVLDIGAGDRTPVLADLPGARQLVLVGNAGSAMWRRFVNSKEFIDGHDNPLDRWCCRVATDLAGELGCRALFPFDGPPYAPFMRWAVQAAEVFVSPLSMHVHRQHGLWHAYRFALVFDEIVLAVQNPTAKTSPCAGCPDQPCLDACPVGAFSPGHYAAGKCLDYLAGHPEGSCNHLGCAARRACPVGVAYTYEPAHARFHMQAFVRNHGHGRR